MGDRARGEKAEHETTEAASLSGSALYSAFIDGIPGLAAILGADGSVLHVNREITDYCGQPVEELRNWGTNGIVHPDDMPHVAEIFGRSIASGIPYDIEQRIRRFDGAYRWFGNRGLPIRDPTGEIVGWQVLLSDIEDRKRAEEAVRASEWNLRQLTETIPQMLWSATPDGAIDYCNTRFLDYTGATPDEVMGNGWADLLLPEDAEIAKGRWLHSIATGDPFDVEVRTFHAIDGTYRWLLTKALPLRDDADRIVKWYGSCVDIHDRKQAENALRDSERHLNEIIDTIPAYVWSAGSDGAVDFYNRSYLEYLGVPAEEIQGWDWASVIHPDDLDALTQTWTNALQTNEAYETQMRVRRFDGSYRWCLSRTSLLRNADGSIKWFGVSIDIDEMKRAQERLRESEINLRQLTETIPQNLFGASATGSVDYLNSRMREWFARSDEKIMAEEWVHLTHPDDREGTVEAWMATVAAGEPYRREVRFLHRSGEYHWCESLAQPLHSADGAIIAWHGVVNDIHDRKLAEDALRTSEQNLQLIIDTIPAVAWSARTDGKADFFNKHYLDYVGLSLEQVREWQWAGVVHPEDLGALNGALDALRASGTAGEMEARVRRHDGAYRWFLFRVSPLRDAQGKVVKWYGVNTDIEELKRATLMLAGERRLLEMIASGQLLRDILGTLCTAVEAAAPGALCEIRPIELSGTIFEYSVAPSLPANFTEPVAGSVFDPETSPVEMAVSRKVQVVVDNIETDRRWSGSPAQARLNDLGLKSVWSVPIFAKDGEVFGCLSVYHRAPTRLTPPHQDIIARAAQIASIAIERSRARDELLRREFLLTTAERISETGSFSWDIDNNKLFWSSQMYRIWELDESIEPLSANLLPGVHPDDIPMVEDRIERTLRGEAIPDNEERLVFPDGRIKYLSQATRLFHYEDGRRECVGVSQDITRRRLAEDALDKVRSELAHVTRVMSLGELAASIAHEVNQPLSGIITNANTCLRMLAMNPPDIGGATRTAQRSIRDGNRASEVIRRLRGLYRKQDFNPEPFNFNEAAQEVVAICAHDLQRRRILLKADLDGTLPHVPGDRIQLQQVILNLVLNAADALSSVERKQRQIFVESRITPDDVVFAVRDNGIGITADDLGRIFNAFFTTKPNGMGIGLSVSKSIVDRHGGKLWATPNDGPGATFAFSIPRAPGDGQFSDDDRGQAQSDQNP